MNIKSLAVLTGGIFLAGKMIRNKFESKAIAHENDLDKSLRAIQEREQKEAKEEQEEKWAKEYSAEFDKKTNTLEERE